MTEDSSQPDVPLQAARLVDLGVLTMSSERDGDGHTIRLSGELDLASAGDVEHELERVEATDARSILVDLSGLTFMDSTGLRLLLGAHARLREQDDRLALRRGPRSVQRVFELSGVDDLLPFAD
jgi:anti-sigma B factor antagonist